MLSGSLCKMKAGETVWITARAAAMASLAAAGSVHRPSFMDQGGPLGVDLAALFDLYATNSRELLAGLDTLQSRLPATSVFLASHEPSLKVRRSQRGPRGVSRAARKRTEQAARRGSPPCGPRSGAWVEHARADAGCVRAQTLYKMLDCGLPDVEIATAAVFRTILADSSIVALLVKSGLIGRFLDVCGAGAASARWPLTVACSGSEPRRHPPPRRHDVPRLPCGHCANTRAHGGLCRPPRHAVGHAEQPRAAGAGPGGNAHGVPRCAPTASRKLLCHFARPLAWFILLGLPLCGSLRYTACVRVCGGRVDGERSVCAAVDERTRASLLMTHTRGVEILFELAENPSAEFDARVLAAKVGARGAAGAPAGGLAFRAHARTGRRWRSSHARSSSASFSSCPWWDASLPTSEGTSSSAPPASPRARRLCAAAALKA
jgi:hypothetical protein